MTIDKRQGIYVGPQMINRLPPPIFQTLIDSEIEFSIAAVPHTGFALTIGDQSHGPSAAVTLEDPADIDAWLDMKARELFPDSDYAKGLKAAA